MIASLDKAAAGVGEVKSVLRACADDLAASLAKLKYLKALVGPFAVCESAVGLALVQTGRLRTMVHPRTDADQVLSRGGNSTVVVL